MSIHHGYIDIGDGWLYYQRAGAGPAIVLIHGNMLDHRMWRFNVPALARRHTVIAYDQRGFGRSSPKAGHIGAVVEDLAELLDGLNIETAVVCGTSMGGVVALHFALEHPGRTAGLVLADSDLSRFAISHDLAEPILQTQHILAQGDTAAAVDIWLSHRMLANVRRHPAAYQLLLDIIKDYSWADWLKGRGYLLDPPALERLHEITRPTLIITGADDLPRFQAIAAQLHREIPAAYREIIPATSHLPNMEAPAAFNQLLLDFAAACPDRR